MNWVRENFLFLLFFILFIGMHLFGHGMHGGHDSHADHDSHGDNEGKGGKQPHLGSHGCC